MACPLAVIATFLAWPWGVAGGRRGVGRPLINEQLCQAPKAGETVGEECKKYFAFNVLFAFGLWMQCGIQVLPGYANRMPKSSVATGDAHAAIYKARYACI